VLVNWIWFVANLVESEANSHTPTSSPTFPKFLFSTLTLVFEKLRQRQVSDTLLILRERIWLSKFFQQQAISGKRGTQQEFSVSKIKKKVLPFQQENRT